MLHFYLKVYEMLINLSLSRIIDEIFLLNQIALYLFPNIVQYFCTLKHPKIKWLYSFQRQWSAYLLKMEIVNIFSEKFANISQKVHSVLLESSTEKQGEVCIYFLYFIVIKCNMYIISNAVQTWSIKRLSNKYFKFFFINYDFTIYLHF